MLGILLSTLRLSAKVFLPPTHNRSRKKQQPSLAETGTHENTHAGTRPTCGCRRWLTSCSASRRSSPQSTVTLVVPSPTSSSWSCTVERATIIAACRNTRAFVSVIAKHTRRWTEKKTEMVVPPAHMFYKIIPGIQHSRAGERQRKARHHQNPTTQKQGFSYERSFSILSSWCVSFRERRDSGLTSPERVKRLHGFVHARQIPCTKTTHLY